jgi:hypothetical protein
MIAAFTSRHIPVRVYTDTKEYRNASRLWHAWNVDRMYAAGIPIKVPAHEGINHQKTVLHPNPTQSPKPPESPIPSPGPPPPPLPGPPPTNPVPPTDPIPPPVRAAFTTALLVWLRPASGASSIIRRCRRSLPAGGHNGGRFTRWLSCSCWRH